MTLRKHKPTSLLVLALWGSHACVPMDTASDRRAAERPESARTVTQALDRFDAISDFCDIDDAHPTAPVGLQIVQGGAVTVTGMITVWPGATSFGKTKRIGSVGHE